MPATFPDPLPLFLGGSGALEGYVQDAETGKPIGGAQLFITPAGIRDESSGTGGFQPYRPLYLTDPDGGPLSVAVSFPTTLPEPSTSSNAPA